MSTRARLVAVVTVKGGWAVQSFGYARHLPLGRPEVLIENLDRWGADEIVVQCIDRTRIGAGPDFALLERLSRIRLTTPLIYGGGIHSVEEGVAVVRAGADRILLDAALHGSLDVARGLASQLGAQALIAALPVTLEAGQLHHLDHRSRTSAPLRPALLDALDTHVLSEALVIDWKHEGSADGFDQALLAAFPSSVPRIAFGGLARPEHARRALSQTGVVAIAVGNALAYREHAIQKLKEELAWPELRAAIYQDSLA